MSELLFQETLAALSCSQERHQGSVCLTLQKLFFLLTLLQRESKRYIKVYLFTMTVRPF